MTPSPLLPPANTHLREAHAHLPMLGEALTLPDFSNVATLHQCLSLISDLCKSSSQNLTPSQPVRIKSLRPAAFTDDPRWPNLAELDRASFGRPLVLMSFDHHQAAANTAALSLSNLAANQRMGTHGIVCADHSGSPTGLLMEDCAYHAWHALAETNTTSQLASLKASLAHLTSLGFTQVHDLHSPTSLASDLLDLERAGQLPMDVWLYPNVTNLRQVHAQLSSELLNTPSARVHLAGGKLFADGTLNARTAAIHSVYRSAPSNAPNPKGDLMADVSTIRRSMAICDELGLHLAVHAIGDRAVSAVLDAVEQEKPIHPGTRIEHCELVAPQDIERFYKLGVTASLQPCHLLYDIEVLKREFGPQDLAKVLPIRSLLESGLSPGQMVRGMVFGSDVPIVRADPQDSVQASVHRRRADMPVEQAINIAQSIDEALAWKCFADSSR